MPKLQDFSVSRNADEALSVVIDSDVAGDTLVGATVEWSVYGMSYGVPLPSPVLIFKSSSDGGIGVPGSPDLFFIINLHAVDTRDLALGNYYHEAIVIDEVMNRSPPVMFGSMAVTLTLE